MQQNRPSHVRHVVLGLTVAAYMITYMDRVVTASAAPYIQKEFGFSVVTLGWVWARTGGGIDFFRFRVDGWGTVSGRGVRWRVL